jgi:hypothetical protein
MDLLTKTGVFTSSPFLHENTPEEEEEDDNVFFTGALITPLDVDITNSQRRKSCGEVGLEDPVLEEEEGCCDDDDDGGCDMGVTRCDILVNDSTW